MKNLSKLLSVAALVLVMFSFCGCNRTDPTTGIVIKGKINTFLDPCHGCCWVVDVKNTEDLDVKNGTYTCPACHSFSVSYNNSIAIPYFNDVETGELTYTGEGTEWLQSLHIGCQVTMICRPATQEDDYRFMSATACTSNHIPAALPKYVVEKIIKVH